MRIKRGMSVSRQQRETKLSHVRKKNLNASVLRGWSPIRVSLVIRKGVLLSYHRSTTQNSISRRGGTGPLLPESYQRGIAKSVELLSSRQASVPRGRYDDEGMICLSESRLKARTHIITVIMNRARREHRRAIFDYFEQLFSKLSS